MTIQDVAQHEGISERQAQRYIKLGFQGHILRATKVGKAWSIDTKDYKTWRVSCGWETAAPASPKDARPASTAPGAQHPAPATNLDARPVTTSPGDTLPAYPPWPLPADPNGELTNGPAPHSRNWPHPEAMKQHSEAQARNMKARFFRGTEDDET